MNREERIKNTYEAMCLGVKENFERDGFVAPVIFLLYDEDIHVFNVYSAWKDGMQQGEVLHAVRNLIKQLDACAVIFIQEVKSLENGVEKRKAIIRIEYIGDDGTIKGQETIFNLEDERRKIEWVERVDIYNGFMFFRSEHGGGNFTLE